MTAGPQTRPAGTDAPGAARSVPWVRPASASAVDVLRPTPARARIACLCLLPALLAPGLVGCVRQAVRKEWPPSQAASIGHRSAFLKAHLKDGSVLVFSFWTVDSAGTRVSGEGRRLGLNRQLVSEGAQSIPVDSVALFETNEVSNHPAVSALAVITGMSVGLTIYCISNPKACFGSCPTFYVREGDRSVLSAEGFSASVAPSLERTDVDALYRAQPNGRDFELHMRNEALETQVVRSVNLLVAPRPDSGRVFMDQAGRFWQTGAPFPLRTAAAMEGDCTQALRDFDGNERFSAADSSDLAALETVDVDFGELPPGDYGLVVGMRQTLMSTYVFYQELAYMGREAGAWLAALELGGPLERARVLAAFSALGVLDVMVPDGAGWKKVGDAREIGPLASDVRLVRLPPAPPGPRRVRLSATRGAWRLDWVGIARLEGPIDPVRLVPVQVEHGGTVDELARQRLLDPALALVTLPGDDYTLRYRLPEGSSRWELFLESRGYYLEWMRDEWLAEESPAHAALMLTDPRRALRQMAPEFKRGEAEMESQFWRSRYAKP